MGKSRHPSGVYRRSKIDKHSGESVPHGKWLPRMKPRREQLSSGEKLIHEHLPLGGCDTPEDAKIVRDIAASYYGKAEGENLTLANGQVFSIPPMTEEEKQSLQGMQKRQWVSCKAREVFEDYKKALKAAQSTPIGIGVQAAQGALVSSEAATTAVASSPDITGSPQLASLSPEDSALNPIFEDLQFDNFDMRNECPTTLDLVLLPSLLWDEGDASKEITSMEVHSLQQQLRESRCQNLELHRQLDEAQMEILELQRQMECVKSKQQCFCLHEPC